MLARYWIVAKGCYQWTRLPDGDVFGCPTCGTEITWQQCVGMRVYVGLCSKHCDYQHLVILPPKPMPTG